MLDHLLSFKWFAPSQIERGVEDDKNNKDDDVCPSGVDNLRNLWLKVTTPFYSLMVELTCKHNTNIYMVTGYLWPMQFKPFLSSIIYI